MPYTYNIPTAERTAAGGGGPAADAYPVCHSWSHCASAAADSTHPKLHWCVPSFLLCPACLNHQHSTCRTDTCPLLRLSSSSCSLCYSTSHMSSGENKNIGSPVRLLLSHCRHQPLPPSHLPLSPPPPATQQQHDIVAADGVRLHTHSLSDLPTASGADGHVRPPPTSERPSPAVLCCVWSDNRQRCVLTDSRGRPRYSHAAHTRTHTDPVACHIEPFQRREGRTQRSR